MSIKYKEKKSVTWINTSHMIKHFHGMYKYSNVFFITKLFVHIMLHTYLPFY